MAPPRSSFIEVAPFRGATDDYGRVLFRAGRLRFIALGTRRGTHGIPLESTRRKPAVGGAAFLIAKIFRGFTGESLRFRLHPWFDSWVKGQMLPGEHVVSSFGYANECFRFARATGGKTFLDAGNSHPQTFWEIMSEEHRRWDCSLPPISKHHYARSLAMMDDLDYVLAPSSFVADSFSQRGFAPERVWQTFYPVDLSLFAPATEPRPRSRPLRIISTAGLSLRKGSPYMLEAFRLVHRQHPSARFLLTAAVHDNMRAVMNQYADLPIDWSSSLPHAQLAQRLQSADVFVLPSLEEGLVRTALEAMACGLPVVLTPNTGANDYVRSEDAGEVVPIRDAKAIADALLKIADRVMARLEPPQRHFDPELLTFRRFEENFLRHLERIGI